MSSIIINPVVTDRRLASYHQLLMDGINNLRTEISSVYRPQGSATVAEINALTEPQIGFVYNVTNSGTITAGNVKVVAGDNIAYTENGWDKLAGEIDLSGYATKESPILIGTPTAPTAANGTNTYQIATTKFVQTEIVDKQDKTNIIANNAEIILVQNNTEIRRLLDINDTPLTITLPDNSSEDWLLGDTEFFGSVIFSTGTSSNEIGTVNIPSSVVSGVDTIPVVYKGEDITSEITNNATIYTFTPIENKRYTFMYYYDGEYMVCEVSKYELPTI